MARRNNTNETKISKCIITPTDRITIMWKNIQKDGKEYNFYDVKYGDVIITGCKVIDGSKGAFLAMPSTERNGEYYPIVYVSHELGDALIDYIDEADEKDTWKEIDSNENITFNSDPGSGSGRRANPRR